MPSSALNPFIGHWSSIFPQQPAKPAHDGTRDAVHLGCQRDGQFRGSISLARNRCDSLAECIPQYSLPKITLAAYIVRTAIPMAIQVYPILLTEDASHDARKRAMEVELVEWEDGKPVDRSSAHSLGHVGVLVVVMRTVFEAMGAHG
jgi:hypothetical protein